MLMPPVRFLSGQACDLDIDKMSEALKGVASAEP